MNSDQRAARVVGVAFILTFVFSIPALWFYAPVLGGHHNYILGSGDDTRVMVGALSEVLLCVSGIATAVGLYPVLKRQFPGLSLGYVAVRIVESTIIAIGIACLFAVVTLRQDLHGSGASAASVVPVGRSLVAVHNATFLLGPSFCAGIGNGILLGFMMFRTGLVPRRMALIGLVGGPLCVLAGTLALLGVYDQNAPIQGLLTLPEAVWEAALGIYLVVRGFRSAPILTARTGVTETPSIPAQSVPAVAAPSA